MMSRTFGIINPGAMGISIAASARDSGYDVIWASSGRSVDSIARAAEHTLRDVGTLEELCKQASIVVSVCPPHAAEAVADAVIAYGFDGLFVDANAISPQGTLRIGEKLDAANIDFVDGSIIGGPAWEAGKTWLYLSGVRAGEVAACFDGGPLETSVIGSEIGKASALKMCFAAFTKGSTALLCAIVAAAEHYQVLDDLETQWSRNGSDFAEKTEDRVRQVTSKAWRFAGEMDEISATFSAAGLPGGFHSAAGELYRRLALFKDADDTPSLDEVLAKLLEVEE